MRMRVTVSPALPDVPDAVRRSRTSYPTVASAVTISTTPAASSNGRNPALTYRR